MPTGQRLKKQLRAHRFRATCVWPEQSIDPEQCLIFLLYVSKRYNLAPLGQSIQLPHQVTFCLLIEFMRDRPQLQGYKALS